MDHEALLRDIYAAFNARDVEAALPSMHPEVDWPNAWEGGRVSGREAVRGLLAPAVRCRSIRASSRDGSPTPTRATGVVVAVHQLVRALDGKRARR